MAAAVNQKQNDNQPDEKQRERTGWRAKEVEEASRTHCGIGVGSTSFPSGKADSGELSRRVSTKVKSFLREKVVSAGRSAAYHNVAESRFARWNRAHQVC